jgi:tetraacyldisaccharide 4'-kinase
MPFRRGAPLMTQAVPERWITARWYDGRGASIWLLPLEWLFRGVTALRRLVYRQGWLRVERLRVPVVVVGNLTVGGTGKTPLVLWLAQALMARGLQPGIVSRGYGGEHVRTRMRVKPDSDPRLVGDEALLLARRSACPVAIGAQRAGAARLLLEAGVNVVIADDGLQHYALGRDVEIVVLDGQRGFGNGHCLPAGPLREPTTRLDEVDTVVVHTHEGGAALQMPGAMTMQMRACGVLPLAGGDERTLESFAGQRVHAVAGIGNPERYFAWLRSRGLVVVPHAFPDHARFRREDINFGDGLPVLMTEKDAVKCARFAGPQHWYVRVVAVLDAADAERLCALVLRVVEEWRA